MIYNSLSQVFGRNFLTEYIYWQRQVAALLIGDYPKNLSLIVVRLLILVLPITRISGNDPYAGVVAEATTESAGLGLRLIFSRHTPGGRYAVT